MKKILLAGVVILLVMFFVTCEEFFPEEKEVEYTDVVYSADGSQVRLYLDGIGVPLTKAQRAMSLELSKMAYDYFEVIFYAPASTSPVAPVQYARAQWELGQSAGIGGVRRGTPYAGGGTMPAGAYAYMAAGTKDGKTLLGVGDIIGVDGDTGTTILTTTQYVTFGLHSVKTGLLVGSETTGTNPEVAIDSLAFTTTPTIKSGGTRQPLGDGSYPMYSLPTTSTDENATYTFDGAAATYKSVLVFARNAVPYADIEKRVPRYMYNGRYLIPQGSINTRTKVTLDTYTTETTKNVVPIIFTPNGGTGIFSFYIDIPVNLANKANDSTNGGPLKPVTWHLRTGFGADLYSLDDGVASGGCVLMGRGVTTLDWLGIEWKWLD